MSKYISGQGGGGCFAANTVVRTPSGDKFIQDIVVGDEVYSFNDVGDVSVNRVSKTFVHESEDVYKVEFWSGFFFITLNHWVLNQYNAFVEVGTLTQDDCLVDEMGHLRPIKSFDFISKQPVYNLTVDGDHTFIADGIRVHNGGKGTVRGFGGGGGGKGGGGRVPVEAADSIRSKQYARVIDLISEGEIVGLVNGLQDVFLEGTPVQNADGSYNYSGVVVETREGTQNQSYIAGFPAVESEYNVSVEVKNAVSVTRTITNPNANRARVTISLPALYQQQTNGDVTGATVEYAIDLQSNGGGFVEKVSQVISDKTGSKYQRSHDIQLTGSPPWDIKVRRVSADPTTGTLQNKTFWESYTEIIDGKFTYPNSALVAIQVDASQFSRIPTRAYRAKLLKVKIPSNYNPTTREYTGFWDGTFVVAWTDNPAWCLYDLMTNTRYGLGSYIDTSLIDTATLYQIAQYCDELVPDGYGGMEPRFTCNLYLQTREEAIKVLTNIASIFRGMIYWSAGSIFVAQDAPADVFTQFTNADVIDGVFNYSGSAKDTRHTVALVSWNDPTDSYKQKVEYVEDPAGIARFGVNETEIAAVGCTSRGQAHRVGKWLLYTERYETEVIAFKTGLKGTSLTPGAIFQTRDANRVGERLGGRVVSSTTNSVTVDSAITITAGKTYTLSLVMPDGSLVERVLNNSAGSATVLTFASALATQPKDYAIWVMKVSDIAIETWRCLAIQESGAEYTINAISHYPEKYALVEQDIAFEIPDTTYLVATQAPVTDVVITDSLYYLTQDVLGVQINVDWKAPAGAVRYDVSYKAPNQSLVTVTTQLPSIVIQNVAEAEYSVSIVAYNILGAPSVEVVNNYTVAGRAAPPSDVTGFSINVIGDTSYLSWDATTDLDLSHYQIRYSPLTSGAIWGGASILVEKVGKPATSITVPTMVGSYLIKAVDYYDNFSVNASSISTSAGLLNGFNVVSLLTENPDFTGLKSNTSAFGGFLQLSGSSMLTWASLSDVDSLTLGSEGLNTSGEYYFANDLDLGAVYTSRLVGNVQVAGEDLNNTMALWASLADVESLDGTSASSWNVQLQVRTTNDDPGGAPTWSAWRNLIVGDYSARAFEFRLLMFSSVANVTPSVSVLEVSVDMPDRTFGEDDIVCGPSGYTVTYTPPFKAAPAIAVSAQGLATGDYYLITGKTASGFTINFKDAGGSGITRTFDYVAKGYGFGT